MDVLRVILLILTLLTITLCNTCYIISHENINNNYSTGSEKIIYDGLPMAAPSKKVWASVSSRMDCNTRLMECNTDSDCQSVCFPINDNKAFCAPETGFCSYYSSKTLCLNDGIPVNYFSNGRSITGCVCPQEYVGRFCHIPNTMKPLTNKTFKLELKRK